MLLLCKNGIEFHFCTSTISSQSVAIKMQNVTICTKRVKVLDYEITMWFFVVLPQLF